MGNPRDTLNDEEDLNLKNITLLFVMLLALTVIGFGCTETDAERVAKKIDCAHDTIKAVITDEAVVAQIPKNTMEKLKVLETDYQAAKVKYVESTKAGNADWSLLKEMVSYGSALLVLIKDLPCVSQYSGEIAVAQATISALINLFG